MPAPHALSGRLRDERGAASVEYAFMAVLIAVAIFVTVGALGLTVSDIFATPELLEALLP